jgi:hypothetical protein
MALNLSIDLLFTKKYLTSLGGHCRAAEKESAPQQTTQDYKIVNERDWDS